MSHKERRTLPAEAIELYNQYVHGEISRRAFLSRAQQFAVAGFTATTLVQALMPDYAMGQQIDRDDERIRAEYVTLPSPQGHGFIKGYLVRPFSADSRSAEPAKLPGIIVVHENRGLNPHTEDVARRLALANFMAFAPDVLTSVGGYPGDDYQGGQLFNGLDAGKRFEDIIASALWLRLSTKRLSTDRARPQHSSPGDGWTRGHIAPAFCSQAAVPGAAGPSK